MRSCLYSSGSGKGSIQSCSKCSNMKKGDCTLQGNFHITREFSSSSANVVKIHFAKNIQTRDKKTYIIFMLTIDWMIKALMENSLEKWTAYLPLVNLLLCMCSFYCRHSTEQEKLRWLYLCITSHTCSFMIVSMYYLCL